MDAEHLAARLREVRPHLAENLVVLDTATSTNDFARRTLEALPPDVRVCDLVVIALEQTGGRGREERAWWSPRGGGLYATLVWGLGETRRLPLVPLAVAVALCRTMRDAGVTGCQVKWPNDLVVGDRKLGGVLIETSGPASGARCVIVGFGINRELDRSKLDELRATSLQLECSDPPDIARLATATVRSVRQEIEAMGEAGKLVERYREVVAHRPGDRMIWRQGVEIVEGYYRGIDASGFLELETESGLRVVNAGEIITG
jgi:BirA family biotin operon repressor/biotin-[acetyl-CoA-carboxylase] ligase